MRFGMGRVDLEREVEPQGFESGLDLPQSVSRGARIRNGDPDLRLVGIEPVEEPGLK